MIDPGSEESSEASEWAAEICCSLLNKWKNCEVWIADTRPWRGESDVRVDSIGLGVVGAEYEGGAGAKWLGSNISPEINGTGNVSGVLRYNLWPSSQNSDFIYKLLIAIVNLSLPFRISDAIQFLIGKPSATALRTSFPTFNVIYQFSSKQIETNKYWTYNNSLSPKIWHQVFLYP